ncbi:MAG: helix-turn-helix transcriptional regulator [Kiritimatiellae bacterium]|nr:helix-turn-helix transcriptional regulator [Kiritimatiellia bacterium]
MLRIYENLQSLGSRLRAERLRRNDTQTMFAARLGISVPTLRKMESGDPGVSVGYWVAALNVLDRAGDLDAILAAPEDLFAKYDQVKQSLPRRASRRSR